MKKSIKTMTWRYGIKLALMLGAILYGIAIVADRYTIGLDTQDTRCLKERIYIIDRKVRPRAADLARGDYVAVRMTEAQTPANALWRHDQVMVKRALATTPGDHVRIDQEGVHFSHGAETWSHGTALEAAPLLGHAPAYFERELTLSEGEMFLMGDFPKSYDSRYYGPASELQIVGTVVWAF